MTEAEINWRLKRVHAAFGDMTALRPEDSFTQVESESHLAFSFDFSGERSQEQLEMDAASVINEIMGIRDRAKGWLKNKGDDPSKVDRFVKSEFAVALVHDLANSDKHGRLDGPPFSGCKPRLINLHRAATAQYDPVTGTYAASGYVIGPSFNMATGEVSGGPSSSNMEIVLIADVHDEGGIKIGEVQKILPDAIYRWEKFLVSEGLALS